MTIAVDPVRNRIYGVSPYDPAIHVFDGANDASIGTISLASFGDGLSKVAVDAGTGLLYVAVDEGRGTPAAGVAVIDPVTGAKALIPMGPQASIAEVAVDPITHRIYVAGGEAFSGC